MVALSWRIPPAFNVRAGVGKRVLRRVLARKVPDELVERPKSGFAVPLAEWLRGPLRPWAEGLLDESRLKSDGLLHPRPVRQAWERLLAGRGNPHGVWAILMLQAWLAARSTSVPSNDSRRKEDR